MPVGLMFHPDTDKINSWKSVMVLTLHLFLCGFGTEFRPSTPVDWASAILRQNWQCRMTSDTTTGGHIMWLLAKLVPIQCVWVGRQKLVQNSRMYQFVHQKSEYTLKVIFYFQRQLIWMAIRKLSYIINIIINIIYAYQNKLTNDFFSKFQFKWGKCKIVVSWLKNQTVCMFYFSCKQVISTMVTGLNYLTSGPIIVSK